MMTGIEIAAGFAVASAVGGAASKIQAGQAQAAAGRANARNLLAGSEAARAAGRERARQVERKNRRLISTGVARVGASGLQMGGSALDVMADNAAEAELERLTTLHLGESQAAGLKFRAGVANAQASAIQTASFLSAGASLLKAGGGIAKSGAFG